MNRRRRPILASTRSRVLVGALVLLAGTLAVSIVVDRTVLLARLDERIDRELAQEVDEFRRLAGGIDPTTGEPFGDDVAAILDTFFSRNVPGEDEVILGLIGGEPHARSANAIHPIEDLDDLVEQWGDATSPTYRSDDSPAGRLRSLVIPINGSDGTLLGSFVVARFPAGERAEVDEAIRVAIAAGAAAFLVATAAAWFIAGRVLQPLRQLADAADAVDEDELGRRIAVQGTGELADLSRTFNGMLDRVEGAFATQRAFLDDAGHELRTPITVVRGHLELTSTDEPFPDSTKDLVLDELDRMSRIVEDLLVMAKAERPDFVTRSPIDIADLTADLAARARPLADRRWEVVADAAVADLDRQRITQAWMNLIRNAVQHTTEGDRITVFAKLDPDAPMVELGVADTGEGVAVEDRERIFERFGRGGSARRTRSDGAGLGLAIVAAIVDAHEGDLRLLETPAGGATFVMRMPLDHPDPPPSEEHPWPGS